MLFEDSIYGLFSVETNDPTSPWDPLLDHDTQIIRNDHSSPRLELRSGTHQGLPSVAEVRWAVGLHGT